MIQADVVAAPFDLAFVDGKHDADRELAEKCSMLPRKRRASGPRKR
jgi:hypothetical protein